MHETVWRQVRLNELAWLAGLPEDGFGSEIAAADGAFHGGGPTRVSPIAGEIQAGNLRLLLWTQGIDSRVRRKCGGGFFYDGGFDELRFASARQCLTDFGEAEVNDLLARLLEKVVGSADDEL
jgi:hypothetical protein